MVIFSHLSPDWKVTGVFIIWKKEWSRGIKTFSDVWNARRTLTRVQSCWFIDTLISNLVLSVTFATQEWRTWEITEEMFMSWISHSLPNRNLLNKLFVYASIIFHWWKLFKLVGAKTMSYLGYPSPLYLFLWKCHKKLNVKVFLYYTPWIEFCIIWVVSE